MAAEVMQDASRHVEAQPCRRVLVDPALAREDRGGPLCRAWVAEASPHGFDVRGAEHERAHRVGEYFR